MSLEKHIEEIRIGIKAGRFMNEAAVSQGIVLRLLNALSWPTYDTQIVCPEYSLKNGRVDYALCHPAEKPIAFVEVKRIGQSEGAEMQLFEYAFHEGVPIVILTDGQEWNFFLPSGQGSYGERSVYKLDIIERDISECVARLTRYLQYDSIVSGDAIKWASEDYSDVARIRQMKSSLPKAWAQLLEEDELLLELVADRVESLCGYKPDPDTVARFLKDNIAFQSTNPVESKRPTSPRTSANVVVPKSPQPSINNKPPSIGFTFEGRHYSARYAIEVLQLVFEKLYERDATILERFASLQRHGRTRRYLARNRDDLYPNRPDLVRDCSMQLASGWWFSTNHSRATIEKIIKMVCEIYQLKYGKDIQVNVGD